MSDLDQPRGNRRWHSRPMAPSISMPIGSQANSGLASLFDNARRCYTTYPVPEYFSASFRAGDYRTAASHRSLGHSRPLSLQLRLPQFGSPRQWQEYERCLSSEIGLQARLFAEDPRVRAMELRAGRATPAELNMFRRLLSRIDDSFEVGQEPTRSIELVPWAVGLFSMEELRQIGFNEVTFAAWNRLPRSPEEPPEDMETTLLQVEAARRAGFRVIDLALAYGRRGQTVAAFDGTLSKVLTAMPHRITLKDFTHCPAVSVPGMERDLPSAEIRLALLAHAITKLTAAGFFRLGMGHFVLADDPCVLAQRHGHLHWGARGYATGDDNDSVGLGISALGAIGPTYSRNCPHFKTYRESVTSGEPPIAAGVRLKHDDLLRRAVIRALVCNLEVSTNALEVAYLVDFDHYFSKELARLAEHEALGLIEREKGWIRVTQRGRMLLRSICMIFDRYHQAKG